MSAGAETAPDVTAIATAAAAGDGARAVAPRVTATRPPGRHAAARRAATAVAAGLGVAASALAFGALWPSGDRGAARPATLSAADAATAREVVAQARRLVAVTPAQLGYRLRVAGPVPGLRGRTDTATRTITLYVGPRDAPGAVAHDLGHELGHAYDATRLSASQRAEYLRARGVPGAPWTPGAQASDYRSGAGDFAEVFALCQAASPVHRSRLAARPQDPCGVLPKQARTAKLGGGGS
jgi:hypothetical protein